MNSRKFGLCLLSNVLLLACLFVAGCGSGGGWEGTASGSIDGYVYAPTGAARVAAAPAGYQPVAGALITVSGTNIVGYSGADGYYTLSDIPVGTYTITITKDGFLPVQRTVTVVQDQKTRVTDENTLQGAMNIVAITHPDNGASMSDVEFRATDTFYIEIRHAAPLAAGSLAVAFKMDNGAAQDITGYFTAADSTTLRSSAITPFTRGLFNLPSNSVDRTMTVTVSARTDTGISGTATGTFTVYPLSPPSR